MSDCDKIPEIHEEDDHESTYRPPPEKSLKEIVEADQNDASLQKYKEALLGNAIKEQVLVEPENPSNVLVKRLALVVDGRPDVVLDLTEDLDKLKKKVFVVKDGIQYRIRIDFYVQREIVTGLRYVQKVLRLGVQHEKTNHMVGSYAPKLDMQSYSTPLDEMPKGCFTRGTYTVKSLFTDDDKNEHLKWEWCFELKKDWE